MPKKRVEKKEDTKLEQMEEYLKSAKDLLDMHEDDIEKLKQELNEVRSKLKTVTGRMGL